MGRRGGVTDDALRDGYDRLAATYAARLGHELDGKPLDRWLLERVARTAVGPVLDVGCGPGHVTGFLAAHGADARGLDLAPAMVAIARAQVPAARFEVGDLRALPDADATLGAVVAMYSLIHLPRAEVPAAIVELARALRPDGLLLLAVHAGTETLHPDALWDIPVDIDWNFLEPDALFAAVAAAGLVALEQLVRWPYPDEHASRRAYVLARKPG
ncbi:MAG: class I SAM-dependent methyltransferase [Myxococcales bacterium]|nr:class I SAM-dependent methyltransferase [Myxococcales bacterium]